MKLLDKLKRKQKVEIIIEGHTNEMEKIDERLIGLINEELSDIELGLLDDEKKAEALGRIEKYYKMLNKEPKEDKEDKEDKKRKNRIEVAKILVPAGCTLVSLAAYAMFFFSGLGFEATGTFTTQTMKNLIGKRFKL